MEFEIALIIISNLGSKNTRSYPIHNILFQSVDSLLPKYLKITVCFNSNSINIKQRITHDSYKSWTVHLMIAH